MMENWNQVHLAAKKELLNGNLKETKQITTLKTNCRPAHTNTQTIDRVITTSNQI